MNLLLINDEEITAETMKQDIDWFKYGIDEVYTAYSAEAAKNIIGEQEIHIMLCDIEMPGENGLSLLRWVRIEQKQIECIFLTCHASFLYAKEAIGLDCQDYILAPAKFEAIGETVHKVVKRIHKRNEELRYLQYGKSALKEKVDHAVECYGEKRNPELLVQDAIDYIMDHLGSDTLSVNEISGKLYLHPVYFNRIFKKSTGTSISQYIISERMKLAADLLRQGKLTANAVAEQVGYKSYSNFNLTFKKYFHCAPSKFDEC